MMRGLKGILRSFHTRKLFLFFVVLFLIPFILITLLILNNLFVSFSQQALREQQSAVTRAMDHLEAWKDTFNRVVTQLVGDSTLKRENLSLYSEQSLLQKKLVLLTASHTGLEDIWYQLPDEDRLISGGDSLSINRLNAVRFSCLLPSDGEQTIYDRLLAGEILPLRDRYKGRDCLFYPYFILSPERKAVQKTMIVFELNLAAIVRELEGLWGASPGMVRLRNAGGETLVLSRNAYSGEFLHAAACPPGAGDAYAVSSGLQGTLLMGEHVISTSVAAGDWAIDLICVNNLVGRFQVMQSVALLLMAVFVLGCCVCVVLSIRLYQPIRSIRDSISSAALTSAKEAADDYDYIESSIELISSDNRQLRLALHSHTEKSREFVASMLFSGRVKSLSEFRQTYSFCGYVPSDEAYRILTLDSAVTPLQTLLDSLAAPERAHFIQTANTHCTLFYAGEDAPRLRKPCAGLGMSAPGESWGRMPLACAQAWFAVSLDAPAFSPALCDGALSAAPECRMVFDSALESGGVSGLIEFGKMLPGDRLRAQLCALAACLLGYMATLDTVILEDASIFHIRKNAGPGELRNEWGALLALLEDLLKPEEKEEGDTLDQMYHYIAKQFDAPNFSIKQMASDFSMSISALSGYFKARAGVLLSDYITEMKMKKAMHLLECTNLSIQEVGLAIGYLNVNSFGRRFHQVTRMTPKEYRCARLAEKNA